MSLVHVLEHLDSPASLGHSISGAFIATLYGVGSANLIFLPISNKLKELSQRRGRLPRDAARGRSSRSRPATTRACSPRSSRRTSIPPSARNAEAAAAAPQRAERRLAERRPSAEVAHGP